MMLKIIAIGAFALLNSLAPTARASEPVKLKSLEGPLQASVIPEFPYASPAEFERGDASRLAILLTDVDSAWLGLAQGLKAIGVPFTITRDYKVALTHRTVFVYPTLSGRTSSPEELRALAEFARTKGTLLAGHVVGGGLEGIFGFTSAVAGPHTRLKFDTSQVEAADFIDENEKTLAIGSPSRPASLVGTYSYTAPLNPPLAVYEDGSPAIVSRHFDSGAAAYAIGPDIGHLLSKGYQNREEDIARSYVNGFEPDLDVLLRLLKNIYVAAEPTAVTLGTVPDGKSLSVVMTHDIDFVASTKNAVEYARYEKSQGFSASYFMQTKYLKDWNDTGFFTDESVAQLGVIRELGGVIESHSVAHSRQMQTLPLGDGAEQYPAYRPFVKTKTLTLNATVLGELRVSKYLLEQVLPGHVVSAFRPGHLSNPHSLPQALVGSGYAYSSAVTANNSLTHLPFQLTKDRQMRQAVNVYEFPVTIEDEAAPKLGDRVSPALALAGKLRRYGGLVVVLIHTDVLDHKLEFEKRFVEGVKGHAWLGDLSQFGGWWAARDAVQVDVSADGSELRVELTKALKGLTLVLPKAVTVAQIPKGVSAKQDGSLLTLTAPAGVYRFRLTTARPG